MRTQMCRIAKGSLSIPCFVLARAVCLCTHILATSAAIGTAHGTLGMRRRGPVSVIAPRVYRVSVAASVAIGVRAGTSTGVGAKRDPRALLQCLASPNLSSRFLTFTFVGRDNSFCGI